MRRGLAASGLIVVLVAGCVLSASQALAQGIDDGSDTYEYTVKTVPALSGVVFTFDGTEVETDALGEAVFDLPLDLNRRPDPIAQARVMPVAAEVPIDETTRARFSQWRGRSSDSTVVAQFNIEYRVSFDLVDVSGRPVPRERIDDVALKSSVGEVRTIQASDAPWLLGTRVVPGRELLEEKPVFWTVQTATDSGLEVVTRGATKFFPAEQQTIEVETLYFDARFEMVDAFFGFPIGNELTIETPDGQVLQEPIVDGVVELEQMARGEYTITVEGPGMRLSRPVSITRNQDVDLKLYSWLDLGLVALFGLVFAITPIYYGMRNRKSTGAADALPAAPVGTSTQAAVKAAPKRAPRSPTAAKKPAGASRTSATPKKAATKATPTAANKKPAIAKNPAGASRTSAKPKRAATKSKTANKKPTTAKKAPVASGQRKKQKEQR